MKEMRDSGISWIKKIPKNWKIKPIKANLSIFSGATPSSSKAEYWDGNIVWVTPADYKTKDRYIFKGKRTITQKGYDSCNCSIVPPQSIIFSKRAPVGSVALSAVSLCTNQGCLSCVAQNNVNPLYFYFIMSVIPELFEIESAGTTFKEISLQKFSNFKLPTPPIEEQQRISDFLDSKCSDIDSIKKGIEKEIETLEEYKKSVITQAVTKGLDKNAEMKNSGIPWIGKIPENWTVMRTRNIAYISIGLVTTMTANYVGKEEGVPLIRNSNIKCNQISYENMAFLSNKFAIANQNRRLHEGQIVTVHTGDIGTSAIIPKKMDGCLGFATIQSTPNSQFINPKFLCWEYNSTFFKNQCIAYCTGDGRQNLNLYDFINLRVIVPPVHEQLEIASHLDSKCSDIDSIISDKQKQLETLDEYKKSLIYEYVTGKKEVPDA